MSHAVRVLAGQDRFGGHKALGISTIDFKVSAQDSGGALLVIENTNRAKGGPARHLHTPGKMEAFFREVSTANAMPPQDPGFWRATGAAFLERASSRAGRGSAGGRWADAR